MHICSPLPGQDSGLVFSLSGILHQHLVTSTHDATYHESSPFSYSGSSGATDLKISKVAETQTGCIRLGHTLIYPKLLLLFEVQDYMLEVIANHSASRGHEAHICHTRKHFFDTQTLLNLIYHLSCGNFRPVRWFNSMTLVTTPLAATSVSGPSSGFRELPGWFYIRPHTTPGPRPLSELVGIEFYSPRSKLLYLPPSPLQPQMSINMARELMSFHHPLLQLQ
jgi:hypothetical protein